MAGLAIKDILSEDSFNTLAGAAIDKGQAFLNNQMTSVFTKATQNEATQTALNAAALVTGMYGTANGLINNVSADEIKTIASQILTAAVDKITQDATAMVAEYTSKHLAAITSFPSNIQLYTLKAFNENKMSIADVVRTITEHADEKVQENADKSKAEQQKNTIDKGKNKLADVTKEVNTYVQSKAEKIQEVLNYISEGPEWIENQLNKQIDNAESFIKKKLDKQWNENDKPFYDTQAKSIGENAGKSMATIYNNQLMAAQNKIMKKIDAQAAKGKTKIKVGAMGSILKLAAKTGVL